jgi:cytochrome c5
MRSRFQALFLFVGLLFVLGLSGQSRQTVAAQSAPTAASAMSDRALLDKYCVTCHNQRLKTADLMLDTLDISKVDANAELLERLVRKLRNGEMPPEGRPKPDAAAFETFLAGLEHSLD